MSLSALRLSVLKVREAKCRRETKGQAGARSDEAPHARKHRRTDYRSLHFRWHPAHSGDADGSSFGPQRSATICSQKGASSRASWR